MTNALRMQLGKVLDMALKFAFLSLVMFGLVNDGDAISQQFVQWSTVFALLVDAMLLSWITATQKDSPSRIPNGMVATDLNSVKIDSLVFIPPDTVGPTGPAIKTSEGLITTPQGPSE